MISRLLFDPDWVRVGILTSVTIHIPMTDISRLWVLHNAVESHPDDRKLNLLPNHTVESFWDVV